MTKLAEENETTQELTDQNQQDLTALATSIKANIRECKKATEKAAEYACKAGEALLTAKKQLRHGEWMNWLRQQCQCSPRQAERYMKIAEYLSDPSNSTRTTNLSQRKLLGLMAEAQDTDSSQNASTGSSGATLQEHDETGMVTHRSNHQRGRYEGVAGQIAPADQEDASQKGIQQNSKTARENGNSDGEVPGAAQSLTMSSVHHVKSNLGKNLDCYFSFAAGTPEANALDELEAEVRKAASKRSRALVTKAMKTRNLNAEMVAVELITRLAQRLIQTQPAS